MTASREQAWTADRNTALRAFCSARNPLLAVLHHDYPTGILHLVGRRRQLSTNNFLFFSPSSRIVNRALSAPHAARCSVGTQNCGWPVSRARVCACFTFARQDKLSKSIETLMLKLNSGQQPRERKKHIGSFLRTK